MTLPHELEKLRDSIPAPKFTSDPSNLRLHAWEAGLATAFTACFQALSEGAGPFDEKAALIRAHERFDGSPNGLSFQDFTKVEMARWQFEADCARIAHAQQIALDRKREWHKERERANELEARLAEREAIAKELAKLHRAEHEAGQKKIDRCQDKLSAAEARVKELAEVIRRLRSALVRIMTTRCAWQLSQEIAREALKGNDGDD